MHISLTDRIKSLFARDRHQYWLEHFTDEEKELRRMNVWQLAAIIEEANVRSGMERKRIVAEHMLDVRLAHIHAKAAWGSGLLGFLGGVFGAVLSVTLMSLLQA